MLGVGPGAMVALAVSSTSMPGRYAYRKLSLPTDGKNRVSPVEKTRLPSRDSQCTNGIYKRQLSEKESGSPGLVHANPKQHRYITSTRSKGEV